MENDTHLDSRSHTDARQVWLVGPLAAALFAISLVGFAAVRTDGYSHATKAISELGAVGAQNATAFNILGFILPGALTVVFAFALGRAARVWTGPVLLIGSGISMMLAGLFAVDLADEGSTGSILHFVGAMGAGFFWVAALFWLGPLLSKRMGLARLGAVTPWFTLFMLANIAWQIAFQTSGIVLPGWGQRIAFFGYFLWLALAGLSLWNASRRRRSGLPD